MKEKLYKILPHVLQNFMVYLYNRGAYKKRYGKKYWGYRKEKKANRSLTFQELKAYQEQRYEKFIQFVINNSEYYKKTLSSVPGVSNIGNISNLPILNKETLRENISKVTVKTNEKLCVKKTGGTTGKSLTVLHFERNIQERFAYVDNFRSQFGYELGKKTAWFSGKSLLTKRDVNKKRFWKTDFINKVRYYSTFHVKDEYLKYYIENIIKFKPEYLVGFPSTMLEIAKCGIRNKYDFPENVVKAIFPTAETVTADMRNEIETFFKSRMYDQYASSEGAPYIFECVNGNLHFELQSGVFEILDKNNTPTNSGRLVVTSFTTEGTPLIRYDIGDSITMEDPSKTCGCGNHNPMVKEILGRIDDYIYSPENGKINLGNISNTLKDTKGIKRFQVVQNELNRIDLNIEVDKRLYAKNIEEKFLENWRDRVGSNMELNLHYVERIPVEKSGKYRIVKNNIKHLI